MPWSTGTWWISGFLKLPAFLKLTNAGPFAAWFVVTGDATPDALIHQHLVDRCMRFRVQGSGFRVQGSGFRVQGSGLRVQGSGTPMP